MTKLCSIPNWSPTVDFVTTTESSRWDDLDGATGGPATKEHRQEDRTAQARCDKIYAAAGRGTNGAIVEYRHGLQANIGIEFDFGTFIRRCFIFQVDAANPASNYHLLLSVAGKSAVLYFDADFSSASGRDIPQDRTSYDLSSPTLIAQPVDQGVILQVTETGLLFLPSLARHVYCSQIAPLFPCLLMCEQSSPLPLFFSRSRERSGNRGSPGRQHPRRHVTYRQCISTSLHQTGYHGLPSGVHLCRDYKPRRSNGYQPLQNGRQNTRRRMLEFGKHSHH